MVGLASLAAYGLRTVAEKIDTNHGPWCEASSTWAPDQPDAMVVPIRVGQEYIQKMMSDDGWAADIAAVFMRPTGDGTFQMYFREADDVDLSANRNVQRMVMSALDMAQALDMSNCDLPDEVVESLSEFKKAARGRLGGNVL